MAKMRPWHLKRWQPDCTLLLQAVALVYGQDNHFVTHSSAKHILYTVQSLVPIHIILNCHPMIELSVTLNS